MTLAAKRRDEDSYGGAVALSSPAVVRQSRGAYPSRKRRYSEFIYLTFLIEL